MPNEYFWANHWRKDQGEEQWECYARVIREIMCEHGGFKTCDLEMKYKFEYKKLLKQAYSEKKKKIN